MPAPAINVTVGDRGPASPGLDDVSTLFAVALADYGPVGTPKECLSLAAVKAAYGDVISDSHLIRTAEAYFREGGSRMVISRAVGPTPTTGVLALAGTGGTVGTVTAASPGAWSSTLTVTVTTGTGSERIVTLKRSGTTILTGTYTTAAGLRTALEATGLVTFPAGVGTWPINNLAETALSAGTADHANITTTQWQAALDAIPASLGPGSVAAPGITTSAVHQALLVHAFDRNRFALLDAIDTPTASTLVTAAGTLRTNLAPEDRRAGWGQMLAPWERVPGPAGTVVTIPPSGSQAGRLAATDASNPTGPGQYAGASFGISKYSVDVTQTYTKADRDLLSAAGVTVIRNIRGEIQAYDAVTLADQATWPQYVEANGMRVIMAIRHLAGLALEKRVLQTIDGRGHLLSEVEKDLVGICQEWYAKDALYGETPAEAFSVDTGPGVNPPAQLAQRKIAAQIELRTSPFTSQVSLLITKVAAGDTI